MQSPLFRTRLAAAISLAGFCALAQAQQTDDTQILEQIEVTTAKIPLPLKDVAANVVVINAEELRERGAIDLRTALSLVAGVDIAPGGDGGPASSVPALWGLREFDAFLLVVDGIPWGGAFTPALATVNLNNVERIEVLKGPAPVSYGATSFVGVIQVIHYDAGKAPGNVEVGFGSRGSWQVSGALSGEADAPWRQSLMFDADSVELSGDRQGWDRAHLLYRGAGEIGGGLFTVDVDGTQLKQDPTSPHPREAGVLTPRVPLDANVNPRGAKQDEDRGQITFGYVLPTGIGDWTTKLAYAHSNADNVKGFLREDFADDGITHNADGFQQDVNRTEVYLDSHFATPVNEHGTFVWGVDYLYGKGDQHSNNFEYAVLPNGANAPDWRTLHIDEATDLNDKRNYLGVYGDLEYQITDAWHVQAGLRYNYVKESTNGLETDLTGDVPVIADGGSDHRNDSRWAGVLGTSYNFWQEGRDYLAVYASYRDTFKPAVVDFGPEAEFEILEPEDAQTGEIGIKGNHLDGHFEWDLSVFRMNFHNLVVSQEVDGLPALTNAGSETFKGAEIEGRWNFFEGFSVLGTYAYHDARFDNYVQDFGGVPTQLDGNLLEMSPQHLGSLGLTYAQPHGFRAYVIGQYVGERYLNKRNTALAGSYTTIDAGLGYMWDRFELRLDGYNLTDRRDPVAESELGDAQYYRLPARTYWLTGRYTFGAL